MVKALLQKLGNGEVPEDGISLLPENVSVSSYDLQDNLLIIDFSKEYSEMSKVREVLSRHFCRYRILRRSVLQWQVSRLKTPETRRSGI